MGRRPHLVAAGNLAAGLGFIVGVACLAQAQQTPPRPDDVVHNPPYAHWVVFAPGTSVTQREVVTLPDGRRIEQRITSKLLERRKDRVVVETTVTHSTGGMVDSTRTVASYPAQVKRRDVSSPPSPDVSVTEGTDRLTVQGQKVDVEWVEAVTRNGDDVVTEKMWTAREIPGGIVKQTLVRRRGGKVVSESVLELVEFKPGS
jgi:hypothetical protein